MGYNCTTENMRVTQILGINKILALNIDSTFWLWAGGFGLICLGAACVPPTVKRTPSRWPSRVPAAGKLMGLIRHSTQPIILTFAYGMVGGKYTAV